MPCDREQPSAKGRVAGETGEPSVRLQENDLVGVFRQSDVAEDVYAVPENRVAISLDQARHDTVEISAGHGRGGAGLRVGRCGLLASRFVGV